MVTTEIAAAAPPAPAPAERTLFGHPAGLAFIVFTEAWERFSFYGMQALLVLYMATYLLHPGTIEGVVGFAALRVVFETVFGPLSIQALTSQIFGIYIGLIYLMPVLGGYLGDRVMGRTRAVLLGAVFMAAGHFSMAFEAAFLPALAFLVVGSGLLKGNLAAQVGGLYARDDTRRNSAFAVYNVSINIGATIAPLVCGTLGELYGWHFGFGAAGIGMLVGIAIYVSGRHLMPSDELSSQLNTAKAQLPPGGARIITAILVLLAISTLFWATQTQVWNVYPLWIREHVDRDILGLTMPVTWFQSIDAGAVLVFAPLVLWYWRFNDRRLSGSDDVGRIACGFAVYLVGFLWLSSSELMTGDARVPLFWPVVFHFILAVGFLYVGPITMSLISKTAPASVTAMMMSSYYLAIFAGSFLSGWLGRFYEPLGPQAFWFLHAALLAVGFALLLVLKRRLSAVLVPGR